MSDMQANAILSCKDLTMRFGGVVALDQISLHVNEGEILGLIGPNGSGKTTFFNVITGVYNPTSGEVDFADNDISRLAAQRVYELGIARTFQRSRLCLPLSIFDNIMIGDYKRLNHNLWFNLFRRKAFRRQFEEQFTLARELVKIFDAPLADRLFDQMATFSMIDRRRIEICRALISRPKLLLLDEPSAGMTHEETRQLMDDILEVRDRMDGLTIIIVEHEMNVIERITERCIVLSYGEKICEGTYQEVASDPGVQEAYLGGE